MAYRYDPDLEFLVTCSSEELGNLVYLLTHDPKDGKKRISESLTSHERYKRHYPDHSKYWQEIAEEFQHFGGNTISNLFRRKGVLYREILCDVCDKMKAKYKKSDSTKIIEEIFLKSFIEKSIPNLSDIQLKEIAANLKIESDGVSPSVLSTLIVVGLNKLLTTQVPVVIIIDLLGAVIGKQVIQTTIGSLIGGTVAGRALGVAAGPIGLAVSGAWLLKDITSPATRVTIPAVLQIIYLRSLSENRKEIEKQAKKESEESSANKSTETAESEISEKENSAAPEINPEFFHFKKHFDKV